MVSAIALEKMTGLTLDYRYYDPWPEREQAVERWRQWLASRNKASSSAGSARKDTK
jgi:hypothetical protein